MPAETLVSVSEYLASSYDPDCDYVDGEILERNVGEYDHAKLQKRLILYLGNREAELRIHVVPEQRVQVSRTRFGVPDVCVVAGAEPTEQVFTKPPALCIEILSPEDTMTRMQERIDDHLKFGVPHVWVLDPRLKRAYDFTASGMREAKDGVLRTEQPPIAIPLAEIFG
jgi:Uma2 family endonuclease